MPAQIMTLELIRLRVAGLGILLDSCGSGIGLAAAAGHARFVVDGADGDGLLLRVRDGPLALAIDNAAGRTGAMPAR